MKTPKYALLSLIFVCGMLMTAHSTIKRSTSQHQAESGSTLVNSKNNFENAFTIKFVPKHTHTLIHPPTHPNSTGLYSQVKGL